MRQFDLNIKWTIKAYNRLNPKESINSIDEIPEHACEFLLKIPYESLITPFVIEDIVKGRQSNKGRAAIARKYNLSENIIRRIGQANGLYK